MAIKGLPKIFSLSGYNPPQRVLVLGCGGTGGHIIPHLARMISVLRKGRPIELVLADGDIVEEKNLIRQNFVSADIGKNKADVMAARYSRAFGFEIAAITEDIEDPKTIDTLFTTGGSPIPLVIGCVDNNASRKMIGDWFAIPNSYGKFWIDSGNEETAGQVICGYAPKQYGGSNTFSLPNVLEIFPNFLDGDSNFNSQLSCAERAQSAPQNMQTNVTAATIAMNYAQKILRGEPLKSHGVDFSIDNAFSTRLNTKENLSKVNPNRRKRWENVY
ncbi:MAG: ThiF family adenylyltransferase [bacterium]